MAKKPYSFGAAAFQLLTGAFSVKLILTIDLIPLKPFYESDNGVIYNDDCMNVMKHIPNKSVDLVLTDPPYGMNFQSNHRPERIGDMGFIPAAVQQLGPHFAQSGRNVAVQQAPVPGQKETLGIDPNQIVAP